MYLPGVVYSFFVKDGHDENYNCFFQYFKKQFTPLNPEKIYGQSITMK